MPGLQSAGNNEPDGENGHVTAEEIVGQAYECSRLCDKGAAVV